MTCSLEDCNRDIETRGLCNMHYLRVKRTGSPGEAVARRQPKAQSCDVAGCQRPVHARNHCRAHYDRLLKGDVRPDEPIKAYDGSAFIGAGGYLYVYVPSHGNASTTGILAQHTLVMSEQIGRSLLPTENVHHLNGDRTDNRPSNLELWSKAQPAGQRVADKVAWAREIIRLYGSDYS